MMINTAVETQGTTPLANYQKLAPVTDTFLFDIKQINSEHHKAMLGIGNEGSAAISNGWWIPAPTSLCVCRSFAATTTHSTPLPAPLITYRSWRSVEISAASTCCRTTSWDAKVRTPGYALPDYRDPSYSPDELDRLETFFRQFDFDIRLVRH